MKQGQGRCHSTDRSMKGENADFVGTQIQLFKAEIALETAAREREANYLYWLHSAVLYFKRK